MVLITALVFLCQITFIFLYRKWEASWLGGLSVVLVAVLAGFLIGYAGVKSEWFQVRKKRFSWWIFLIPLIAYAISGLVGIYFVEPEVRSVEDLPIYQPASYQYTPSQARIDRIEGRGMMNIMDGAMDIDCDDEGCLVLILVVIAVICVVASACIPHFWVVATTVLWVIMLLISTRELLFRGGGYD
jgi:hypothetical protein